MTLLEIVDRLCEVVKAQEVTPALVWKEHFGGW